MSWRATIGTRARQVRIFLDTTSEQSNGLKSFVEKNYQELKLLNPTTPFLVRMRDGAEARLFVRDFAGAEQHTVLEGASEQQVEDAFKALLQGAAADEGGDEGFSYVVEGGSQGLCSDPWMKEYVDDAEAARRT